MRIEVTQEDIDNGGIDGGTCPVAIAASRTFGFPVWAAREYLATIDIDISGPNTEIARLPAEATAWIMHFDDDDELVSVKPFSFEVTPYEDREGGTPRQ